MDGKSIQSGLTGNIEVTIKGDVNNINCTGSVFVHGNVTGNIDCGGSCSCSDAEGDVDSGGSSTVEMSAVMWMLVGLFVLISK